MLFGHMVKLEGGGKDKDVAIGAAKMDGIY